jgi:hypothetical protein
MTLLKGPEMFKRSIGVLGVLAAGFIFSNVASGQTSSPATADSAGAAKTAQVDVQDKNISCPAELEFLLPGDFYACEARAAFGRGNHKKMADMLKESAYWANKDAQYVLGLAYFNGDMEDVPQNRPLGLAWLSLAAERKKPQYQLAYEEARAKATPEEISQALALSQQMQTKYGDSVAAPRAIRRFNHAIEPIDEAAREGGTTYLRGFSPYPESSFAIANQLHDEASTDFDDTHGQVVVGKPEWLQAPPVTTNGPATNGVTSNGVTTNGSPANGSSQQP